MNRYTGLLDLTQQAVVVGKIAMRAAGNDRRFPAITGQVFQELGGPLDTAQAHRRKVICEDEGPARFLSDHRRCRVRCVHGTFHAYGAL